jgi:hypothetical protein
MSESRFPEIASLVGGRTSRSGRATGARPA